MRNIRLKVSWFVTVLLLLSIFAMVNAATTSGYVSPEASFTLFPSFTYHPSFTFSFTTAASSTHMFTFIPSFTFIFPTTTGSTPTLPPATSTFLQQTDWAVLGVDAFPPNPQPGDQMFFSMSFTALSSNTPFPQTVYVQCQIDGFSCGAGPVAYSGPAGSVATVSADSYWPASPGPHVLTWFVAASQDPDSGNNVLSIQFFVQTPQPPTTMVPSIQTTQVTVAPSSMQPPSTIVETSVQTVTQSPTGSSTGGVMGFSLQDYTLPLVVIILILVVGLALAMRKRKPTGPAQGNVWYCTHCGTPNSLNSNFCSKCGSAKPQ